MAKQNNEKDSRRNKLRQQAELMAAQTDAGSPASPGCTADLYELRVQQIELELQNEELEKFERQLMLNREELLLTRDELQRFRDRYFDLFDNAPTAYFTIDLITYRVNEMNLTACEMLGGSRKELVGRRFSTFIAPEFADSFHICSRKALREPYRASCEVKMRREDGSSFWALTELRSREGDQLLRASITDITENRLAY